MKVPFRLLCLLLSPFPSRNYRMGGKLGGNCVEFSSDFLRDRDR